MVKWTASLGLGLVICAGGRLMAQDSFPTYEPPESGENTVILQAPQSQTEPPIIQTQAPKSSRLTFTPATLKSRSEKAHLRTARTPAQEYIHQRAVFEAQQRARRIQLRKWQGKSALRPGNRPDHSAWYEPSVPVWFSTFSR